MKKTIIEHVLSELERERLRNQEAFKSANAEANQAEGAMQSRFSTFKEEAQDLASAYAKRMNELGVLIVNLHRMLNDSRVHLSSVGVNSLVRTEKSLGGGVVCYYLILPQKGGYSFFNSDDSSDICVLNKESPFAKILLGKQVGEVVLLPDGEKYRITKIQ